MTHRRNGWSALRKLLNFLPGLVAATSPQGYKIRTFVPEQLSPDEAQKLIISTQIAY
jgi:hypothetical protein